VCHDPPSPAHFSGGSRLRRPPTNCAALLTGRGRDTLQAGRRPAARFPSVPVRLRPPGTGSQVLAFDTTRAWVACHATPTTGRSRQPSAGSPSPRRHPGSHEPKPPQQVHRIRPLRRNRAADACRSLRKTTTGATISRSPSISRTGSPKSLLARPHRASARRTAISDKALHHQPLPVDRPTPDPGRAAIAVAVPIPEPPTTARSASCDQPDPPATGPRVRQHTMPSAVTVTVILEGVAAV
jgi:hypothetical protein